MTHKPPTEKDIQLTEFVAERGELTGGAPNTLKCWATEIRRLRKLAEIWLHGYVRQGWCVTGKPDELRRTASALSEIRGETVTPEEADDWRRKEPPRCPID